MCIRDRVGVPATGADDHGRPVRVTARGHERGERGVCHLGNDEVPGTVPDMFFRDGFRFFGVEEELLRGRLLRWQMCIRDRPFASSMTSPYSSSLTALAG